MSELLEHVDSFDKFFLERLEDYNELKVYKFQDYDLKWMKKLLKFGEKAFGDETYDVYSIVFQIYYGNVFILKDGDDDQNIEGVAAFSRAWDDDDLVYLSDFAISENARGKSIDKQFMKMVIGNIKDQGFKTIRLTVNPTNESAVILYQKSGFEIVEKIDELYGPGADRYIMELNL